MLSLAENGISVIVNTVCMNALCSLMLLAIIPLYFTQHKILTVLIWSARQAKSF